MTVLHSGLNFIEEHLPSYYEKRDKKNPLKETQTPKFINSNTTTTPIHHSMRSNHMERALQGTSFNGIMKKSVLKSEDETIVDDEDMLFHFDQEKIKSKISVFPKKLKRQESTDIEVKLVIDAEMSFN